MGRLISALVLMVVLSGCSGVAGMLLPSLGKGINADAELVVGDKAVETQVGSRREEVVNAQEVQINNQEIPLQYMLLLILMAGWAIPDPATCGRGFLKLLPWTRSDN